MTNKVLFGFGLLIAYLSVFFCIIIFILNVYYIPQIQDHIEDVEHVEDGDYHPKPGSSEQSESSLPTFGYIGNPYQAAENRYAYYIDLCAAVCGMVASPILLYGLHSKQEQFMHPWLVLILLHCVYKICIFIFKFVEQCRGEDEVTHLWYTAVTYCVCSWTACAMLFLYKQIQYENDQNDALLRQSSSQMI